MLYWVNMNLISHSLLSAAAKQEGDEEPVRVWKKHNSDCQLTHRNIDLVAKNMEIQLFHSRMEQAEVRGMRMAKSNDMTSRDPSRKVKHAKRSSPGVSTQGWF